MDVVYASLKSFLLSLPSQVCHKLNKSKVLMIEISMNVLQQENVLPFPSFEHKNEPESSDLLCLKWRSCEEGRKINIQKLFCDTIQSKRFRIVVWPSFFEMVEMSSLKYWKYQPIKLIIRISVMCLVDLREEKGVSLRLENDHYQPIVDTLFPFFYVAILHRTKVVW